MGISHAIVSSPVSPVGRKLTVGAARSTMKQKFRNASSSTCTILKIGLRFLTCTSSAGHRWLCLRLRTLTDAYADEARSHYPHRRKSAYPGHRPEVLRCEVLPISSAKN